ncbi:hypothetical protein MFU01_70190 [Myxococcus fulvus]|uniref:Uncharacterized protein n=1 Tax=Myxococcus fulvus TaxID=33 RepID=A0A511TF06_MYXFU|nr:hypothetical protein MFU01_70190 [Myxococcus fulvus]
MAAGASEAPAAVDGEAADTSPTRAAAGVPGALAAVDGDAAGTSPTRVAAGAPEDVATADGGAADTSPTRAAAGAPEDVATAEEGGGARPGSAPDSTHFSSVVYSGDSAASDFLPPCRTAPVPFFNSGLCAAASNFTNRSVFS